MTYYYVGVAALLLIWFVNVLIDHKFFKDALFPLVCIFCWPLVVVIIFILVFMWFAWYVLDRIKG